MSSGNVLQLVLPILALLGVILLLKGLHGGLTTAPVSLRPMPLMTPTERRTIEYIEQILPWARVHAQCPWEPSWRRMGLNRSQGTTVRKCFPMRDCRLNVSEQGQGQEGAKCQTARYHRSSCKYAPDFSLKTSNAFGFGTRTISGYAHQHLEIRRKESGKSADQHRPIGHQYARAMLSGGEDRVRKLLRPRPEPN